MVLDPQKRKAAFQIEKDCFIFLDFISSTVN